MRNTKMYRWAVAIEGALSYTNYEGYKTKRVAQFVAEEMTRLTNKKHIVIDTKRK